VAQRSFEFGSRDLARQYNNPADAAIRHEVAKSALDPGPTLSFGMPEFKSNDHSDRCVQRQPISEKLSECRIPGGDVVSAHTGKGMLSRASRDDNR